MLPESIKTLLEHLSKNHVKNLQNADQVSTIEDLLISEEDDSLPDVTLYFEDGPFFYNVSFRSKVAKPKKLVNLAKYRSRETWVKEKNENAHDDKNSEIEESPPKSEFKVDQNYVCKYCLTYFSRQEACRNHEKTFHEKQA